MKCDECMCRHRAYPILSHITGTPAFKEVDTNCPMIKFARTEDANYYWCHVGGPPPKPMDWYPGRGY